MGVKTALFLIVVTDGFNKFENAKQLCSYVGITPTIRASGSSVRGRSRISKIGNRKLRNLLFLCAFSACNYNKACKELYERIIAKGIEVIIYEPVIKEVEFFYSKVIKDLDEFKKLSDLIVANRISDDISDVKDKVYTRDLFNGD